MLNLADLVGEYDEELRIMHLTARKPIRFTTREHGYALAAAVKELLARHLKGQRGYMITDYSKIIIEPLYVDEYAAQIKEIVHTHLHPDGLARYGYEISRVTAQLSHNLYLDSAPNLFNTKEEAYQYIHGLIDRQKEMAANGEMPSQVGPFKVNQPTSPSRQ